MSSLSGTPAGPAIREQVQPAQPLEWQTPLIRHASTPNVMVHIGAIELQFAPPAPARTPRVPGAPRRRTYGFDAFHRLRSSGGWDE
jgi:hypothetical protein